jgi:hypothetical protein
MKRNLNRIITEVINSYVNNIITEGRNAEKARQNTLQVIRDFFHGAAWLDNEYVSPDANPNHLSVIDYIEDKLREKYFHANSSDALIRLEPILMKVALSLGFEQEPLDTERMNRLTLIVNYIKTNYKKPDFPIQLNKLTLQNTTYDSLNNMFGHIVDEVMAADNQSANSLAKGSKMNPDYEVIRVDDFETAHEIGEHSCSQSKLCYTQDKSIWDNTYIKDANVAYAILRKDYLDIPEEHGENTPYDEYGLSMIFLFIDPRGNIAYSNTRWNHRTNGQGPSDVDQSFTKSDISKLLNVNFDEVFKGNTIDYNDYFIVRKLNNGLCLVKTVKGGLLNFINAEGKVISDTWFDDFYGFKNGFARVELDKKFNLISAEGRVISDTWFDEAYSFREGFAMVKLNRKYNYLTTEGQYLSGTWFENAISFKGGLALVKLNGKWNFINTELRYLSDTWFDYANIFYEGFALVKLNRKYNFLNTEGWPISDMWFDNADDFKGGLAMVNLDEQWNYINSEGKLLSDTWFDGVYGFSEGFSRVWLNGKYNFISIEGQLLSDTWFDEAFDFTHGFTRVCLDGKWYRLDEEGHLTEI